jgi:hypothetical protein
MTIIRHPSDPKTLVMIGSTPQTYFANCKDSAGFVANVQGSSGNFGEALQKKQIAATSGRLAYVLPQWSDASKSDDAPMTFKNFYTQEWFKQVWFIPLSSEIEVYNPASGNIDRLAGSLQRNVLSTFLVRSQSRDNLISLIEPIKMQAFDSLLSDPTEFLEAQKLNPDISEDEYVAMKSYELFSSKVLTFRFEKGTGISDYKYIIWEWSEPTEAEKLVLELAQVVGTAYADVACVNKNYDVAIAAANDGLSTDAPALPPPPEPAAALPSGGNDRKRK